MANNNTITQAWKIDPSIDVKRVTLDDVKLVFGQAEKRLDDTVKTGESVASKTMSLVTLMAGVLIALSGYVISNWKGIALAGHRDMVAILGAIYVIFMFVYTIKNVLPSNYYVLGSEPSELMLPSFFDAAIPLDKITVFMYMNEIENYDFRIERNLLVNAGRWKRFRFTVIALLILPILLGTVYMLLEWLCQV